MCGGEKKMQVERCWIGLTVSALIIWTEELIGLDTFKNANLIIIQGDINPTKNLYAHNS